MNEHVVKLYLWYASQYSTRNRNMPRNTKIIIEYRHVESNSRVVLPLRITEWNIRSRRLLPVHYAGFVAATYAVLNTRVREMLALR